MRNKWSHIVTKSTRSPELRILCVGRGLALYYDQQSIQALFEVDASVVKAWVHTWITKRENVTFWACVQTACKGCSCGAELISDSRFLSSVVEEHLTCETFHFYIDSLKLVYIFTYNSNVENNTELVYNNLLMVISYMLEEVFRCFWSFKVSNQGLFQEF